MFSARCKVVAGKGVFRHKYSVRRGRQTAEAEEGDKNEFVEILLIPKGFIIPAKAGIQRSNCNRIRYWIPAFAGMMSVRLFEQ